jgi:hypothetical protein
LRDRANTYQTDGEQDRHRSTEGNNQFGLEAHRYLSFMKGPEQTPCQEKEFRKSWKNNEVALNQ